MVLAASPVVSKLRFGPLYIKLPFLVSSYPVAPATAFHDIVAEEVVTLEDVGIAGAPGGNRPPPDVVTLVVELKFDVVLALYALTVKL